MTYGRRQKSLVVIVAREFASLLATPVLISDEQGRLVYFNEPAERVLGTTYAEAGELDASRWEATFRVTDLEGRPMSLEQMPGGVAFRERRPAQGMLSIVGLDGVARVIAVTAFPLFAHEDELVGIVAIFWESAEVAAA